MKFQNRTYLIIIYFTLSFFNVYSSDAATQTYHLNNLLKLDKLVKSLNNQTSYTPTQLNKCFNLYLLKLYAYKKSIKDIELLKKRGNVYSTSMVLAKNEEITKSNNNIKTSNFKKENNTLIKDKIWLFGLLIVSSILILLFIYIIYYFNKKKKGKISNRYDKLTLPDSNNNIHFKKNFSPRQKEVILLLKENKSNKEIAAKLNISENTVKYHIKKIFNTLGISKRREIDYSIFDDKNKTKN